VSGADGTDDDFAWGDGGFVKVYGDRLADSSLMDCAVATRWAFIVMLSKADSEGRFRCATVAGLSRCSAISMAEAEQAVRELEAPDDTSTSSEAEGRRIVRIPGGWQLVNYVKYRDFRTRRQIEDAKRQEEYRSRRRDESRDNSDESRDVPVRSAPDVRRKTSNVRQQKEQEHMAGGRTLPDDSPASQPAREEPEPREALLDKAFQTLDELVALTGLFADELVRGASKTPRGKVLTNARQLESAPVAWVRVTADRLHARLCEAREARQREPPGPEPWQLEREARRRKAKAQDAASQEAPA
jgi:hypothetical protein